MAFKWKTWKFYGLVIFAILFTVIVLWRYFKWKSGIIS